VLERLGNLDNAVEDLRKPMARAPVAAPTGDNSGASCVALVAKIKVCQIDRAP